MSERLPILTGSKLIQVLQKLEFQVLRRKRSHVRLRHPDGRLVTVPDHKGKDIARGLLRKILRDSELTERDLRPFL